jgi:hypothetical protein
MAFFQLFKELSRTFHQWSSICILHTECPWLQGRVPRVVFPGTQPGPFWRLARRMAFLRVAKEHSRVHYVCEVRRSEDMQPILGAVFCLPWLFEEAGPLPHGLCSSEEHAWQFVYV